MTHSSLCTGIGACELAATWLGWQNAFSCEINEFCQRVLKYHYPNSKHYENIFGTDFSEWRGKIDILTAGFPCQPFSVAGERKGAEDDRYLWPEVLRVINEVRPTWFIGENVAGITSMVLPGEAVKMESYTDIFDESYLQTNMCQQFVVERICNDLEGVGYSVQPVIIPACAVEAPHRRDRIWFIANANSELRQQWNTQESERRNSENFRAKSFNCKPNWQNFPTQSPVCCGDDGIPTGLSGITVSKHRQESIKAYGNTMVPQVVYEIFKAINEIENYEQEKQS